MKPEDFLSDDFLKQFKTGEQLNDFLARIQKRAIEKMLEGKLDDHLDYNKYQQRDSPNARNGHGKKKIKSGYDKWTSRYHVTGRPVLTRSWCPNGHCIISVVLFF